MTNFLSQLLECSGQRIVGIGTSQTLCLLKTATLPMATCPCLRGQHPCLVYMRALMPIATVPLGTARKGHPCFHSRGVTCSLHWAFTAARFPSVQSCFLLLASLLQIIPVLLREEPPTLSLSESGSQRTQRHSLLWPSLRTHWFFSDDKGGWVQMIRSKKRVHQEWQPAGINELYFCTSGKVCLFYACLSIVCKNDFALAFFYSYYSYKCRWFSLFKMIDTNMWQEEHENEDCGWIAQLLRMKWGHIDRPFLIAETNLQPQGGCHSFYLRKRECTYQNCQKTLLYVFL